jgi:predicted transcriptional regulator
MPYPERPTLSVLAEFVGTATIKQTAQQRARLLAFCSDEYAAGWSIRELAELTGRTQSVLCICQRLLLGRLITA